MERRRRCHGGPRACDAYGTSIELAAVGVSFAAADVCTATNGTLRWGPPDIRFHSVSIDSRSIELHALFVPLSGAQTDGHRYIPAAVENGAAGFFFNRRRTIVPPDGAIGIAVNDPLSALQDLAGWYARRLSATVIGIAGSNGKTTTKELTAQVFAAQRPTLATHGNFNNHIGLPLSLLRADLGDEFLVLEMGTSRPGEITRLCGIVQPRLAVITSIAEEHTETLGDLAGVLAAETEIVAALPSDGVAIVNGDDGRLTAAVRRRAACRIVTFGEGSANHVRASDIRLQRTGTGFRLATNGQTRDVWLPLLGRQSVLAALAAVAVAVECGLDVDAACATLATARGAPHRLAVVDVPAYRLTVLDDCYNANPASLRLALDTAASLRQAAERLILVIGDMLELGDVADQRHTEVGTAIAALTPAPDAVVTVGRFAVQLAEPARTAGIATYVFADVDTAVPHIRALLENSRATQLMLVKASRGVHLEHVIEWLVDARGIESAPTER